MESSRYAAAGAIAASAGGLSSAGLGVPSRHMSPGGIRGVASTASPIVAGIIASLVGLFVFMATHALWVRPIWFILPAGVLLAPLGGLAVGWAYAERGPRLPRRPWTALAVAGIVAATLVPAGVIAEVRGPLVPLEGGVVPPEHAAAVVRGVVAELLMTAALVGGMLGWLLGRTPRAALATACAGLVFAAGPGHNIPLVGGTPGAVRLWSITLAVIAVSAVVLVEVHAALVSSRARQR